MMLSRDLRLVNVNEIWRDGDIPKSNNTWEFSKMTDVSVSEDGILSVGQAL